VQLVLLDQGQLFPGLPVQQDQPDQQVQMVQRQLFPVLPVQLVLLDRPGLKVHLEQIHLL
jgi:hypothetical protein